MVGDPLQLGKAAKRRIEKQISVGGLAISDISLWEVAMLAQKRRIEIIGSFLPWIENAVTRSRVIVQPITPEIAFESTLFPDHLSDPADRIIAGTTRCLGVALITKDRRLQGLAGIETIW